KQTSSDRCSAVCREEPQLVNLLWWKLRQVAGQEDQIPVARQINCLTPRLWFASNRDQFYLLRFRVEQRFDDFFCLLKLRLLAYCQRPQRRNIGRERSILPHEQDR